MSILFCGVQVQQLQLVQTQATIVPPYADLSYPHILSLLRDAEQDPSPGQEVALGELTGLSKRGIAGNGICEVGELPGADNNGAG